MTAVTVRVTEEHIAAGIQEDCTRCPVALAIRDAVPGYFSVMVFNEEVRLAKYAARGGMLSTRVATPVGVKDWIYAFDRRLVVAPITFELELPE